jgi:hypothetical protein
MLQATQVAVRSHHVEKLKLSLMGGRSDWECQNGIAKRPEIK